MHVLQVGAQNQNAVGLPANSAPSMAPPPTFTVLKLRISGTATGAAAGAADGATDAAPATVVTGAGDAAEGATAVAAVTGELAEGAAAVVTLFVDAQLARVISNAQPTSETRRFFMAESVRDEINER